MLETDTIAAIATPAGVGGIAVIRVSGPESIEIVGRCWQGKPLSDMKSHTVKLGKILAEDGSVLDEVVLTLFRAPRSFTGETVVEIACHGSKWIQREIVNRLVHCGARPATAGEFTQRAFLNGRIDLAQAEGVADLIAASSRASHRLAQRQASGEFSSYLNSLRESLIEVASLLELELDFSEEDVEFADREKMRNLVDGILSTLRRLAASYSSGRAIKEGVPVVIAGAPNAGKSTLLNALLGEEKAIVTNIPGTTRDVIEDTREIGGVLFRFVDTAGLRTTIDVVEQMGITRAEQRIERASIVVWVLDMTEEYEDKLAEIRSRASSQPDAKHILVCNKIDKLVNPIEALGQTMPEFYSIVEMSAREGKGVDKLIDALTEAASNNLDLSQDIIVSNARHYDAILRGIEALERLEQGMTNGLSGDFLAQDLREALHHLSMLTGSISTPDLLASIFENFCIGK